MPEIRNQLRGRVAGLSRAVRNGERRADDPALIDAKRKLIAENTAVYIKRVLAQRPPLTDEQRTRLAELLRPVRQPVPNRKTAVSARLAELDGGAA
ncbi:MAG: hypothetical protein WA942_03215 [Mycolicibacter sinensis]